MKCVGWKLTTDPWPVGTASLESVSEAEDWATSNLSSVELLPAAAANGLEVPCLPRAASFVALWATLRCSIREVGCVIAASWREDSDRQLPGSSEVVGLAQVAPLPKVPCACTPGAGSQVAKSRPLRHQATWTVPVILAPQCAGSGGMAFFVFRVKFNYTHPVRGNQEPPRTPGRGHPPDTTGNPCPTESRRYRPRTGPKAGPEPGPRPDRIPRAPDPNPTTPSEGKPSTISPVSRTDVPRYVGTWHVGI